MPQMANATRENDMTDTLGLELERLPSSSQTLASPLPKRVTPSDLRDVTDSTEE
jgi:hypothetical protein